MPCKLKIEMGIAPKRARSYYLFATVSISIPFGQRIQLCIQAIKTVHYLLRLGHVPLLFSHKDRRGDAAQDAKETYSGKHQNEADSSTFCRDGIFVSIADCCDRGHA